MTLEGVYRLVDRASPSLRAIERRAEAADRAINKLGRSMDKLAARDAIGRIDKLGGSMQGLEQDTNRVERVMGRAGVATRKATGEMGKHEASVRKSRNEMGRFEAAMRKVVVVTSGLGRLLRPAMFLGIAAVIRPLVGVVMSLVAGATALVQQLVSATGAVVPLISRLGSLAGTGAVAVTMFLSLKAATLTTKFAFDGVKQAINGNAAALKKLTPEARAFVSEMKKLQPVMNQLRASAQRGLFPGITGALRTARRNGAFQQANQAIGGVGSAVGGVAQGAANRLTDPAVLRDLGQQFRTFDVVISRVGAGAVSLIDALHNILFAAQPLTRWVASLVQQWGAYLDRQTQVARETGALGRYFENTRRTLTAVGHTVRDFGMGFINIMRVARGESGNFAGSIERSAKAFREWTENFGNQARVALWFQRAQENAHRLGQILVNVFNILTGIGKASQQLGGSLTQSIEVTTRRWSEWVNSFQGQNAINDWMNGMRTTLGQIWGLLSDLTGAFARMGAGGGGAVGLLQALRGLIPDLERALTAFNKNIGPGLYGTVAQLVHLLATLTSAGSGPLGLMLRATNNILASVNHLLDRFRLVRVAVVGAVVAIGGALLIRKLRNIALEVGDIARKWAGVTEATVVATEAAGRYSAVAAGGAAAGGFGGMPGFPRAVGAGGAVAAGAEGAAVAGRFARFRGLLAKPGVGLGAGIGLPIAAGIGTELAADGGLISQRRAGQVMNVASMAGTGALLGSFVAPGLGTAIGAGLGAGAGLAMNAFSGGGGPSPQQRYLESLQRTARQSGFDIGQQQGGAQNLAGAESYQGVLDRSRERLLSQRRMLAGQPSQTRWAGGRFGQAYQSHPDLSAINAQLRANQVLRGQNIARLGQERAIAKAQREQTDELRKQARARSSRSVAAGLATSYGEAYNVYRAHGLTTGQATRRTVTNMLSRAKTLQPAGARVLFEQGTAWLAQQTKLHPELKKEQDRWNTDMEATLKKMHVTVTTAGNKVLSVSKEQWQNIASAMQTPVEKARQEMGTAFTQLQLQARAVLIGMGYTAAQANNVIRTMEAGGAGPAMNANPKAGMQHRAMGGRIPGMGLRDTVPIGPGAMAAPGELIVNRHTESRADQLLRRAGAPPLGRLVAGETKNHSDILPDAGILGFAKGGRLGAAIREANRIDAMHIPYAWGGSHGTPSNPGGPWDCSSATSRVLQAAGYGNPTMVSGSFMNWGLPGPGPIGIAANRGHVYMVLNGRAWGTSRSNPGGGPGWISGYTYRPGFAIRHAPGAGGAGGAFAMDSAGPGGLPLMGPLNYSAFSAGLSGVPAAINSRGGHAEAVGLRGKINKRLIQMGNPHMAHHALGGRMPEWGGWHADGLDATFHRPTMIGVGERGSERVTVGPTRGGGLTIQHMEIHVQGHQPGDVKREVEAALMDVARAIDRAPTTGGA